MMKHWYLSLVKRNVFQRLHFHMGRLLDRANHVAEGAVESIAYERDLVCNAITIILFALGRYCYYVDEGLGYCMKMGTGMVEKD